MSKRSIRAAVSVAVLAGATAVTFQLSTGSAAADEAFVLPIASVGDVVVDGASKQVFISDPAGGKLIATDYAGKVLATQTGLPGINELLFDGRIYAAVPGLGGIATFGAAGLTKDTVYAFGAKPQTLARNGAKVWFGEDNAGLGFFDVSGGDPATPGPKTGDLYWSAAPRLAASPKRPGVLAAVDTTISPSTVKLVDVTTSPPTEIASRTFTSDRIQGLAFTPNGDRLVVAGQSLVQELSATDLTTAATYQAADPSSAGLAMRADGVFAVGAGPDAEDAVALYTPGTAAAVEQLDLRAPVDENGKPLSLSLTSIASNTLAWEPGGRRLFGVAYKGSTGPIVPEAYSLQVLNDPVTPPVTTPPVTTPPTVDAPKATTLALSPANGTYNHNATVNITARLGATRMNRMVEIWADPYGNDQPNRLVRKANVDGGGYLKTTFKVTRNTTFSTIFRGDAGTAARTVKSTVSTRASVAGTLTRHYKTGKIGSTSYQYFRTSKLPVLNIAVSPYPNRKAYTEIHRYQGGKWVLWSGSLDKLDKAGKAKRSVYTMTEGARFRIRTGYAYGKSGDTANASTYSPWRYYTITR